VQLHPPQVSHRSEAGFVACALYTAITATTQNAVRDTKRNAAIVQKQRRLQRAGFHSSHSVRPWRMTFWYHLPCHFTHFPVYSRSPLADCGASSQARADVDEDAASPLE